MENQTKKLLTILEAAELLTIKVSRLRTAVFRKEIPFIKIGRLVRFKEEDLMDWVTANTHKVKKGFIDELFS
jgi:excisionase family DNA binding protein